MITFVLRSDSYMIAVTRTEKMAHAVYNLQQVGKLSDNLSIENVVENEWCTIIDHGNDHAYLQLEAVPHVRNFMGRDSQD